ncbi:MAG: hypothetical protein P4L65_02295 [Legionella sp.]|nr:hypothetical protein [Legionella sp.]
MTITRKDLEEFTAPHPLEISPASVMFLTTLLNDETTSSNLLELIKKNKISLRSLMPALVDLSNYQILNNDSIALLNIEGGLAAIPTLISLQIENLLNPITHQIISEAVKKRLNTSGFVSSFTMLHREKIFSENVLTVLLKNIPKFDETCVAIIQLSLSKILHPEYLEALVGHPYPEILSDIISRIHFIKNSIPPQFLDDLHKHSDLQSCMKFLDIMEDTKINFAAEDMLNENLRGIIQLLHRKKLLDQPVYDKVVKQNNLASIYNALRVLDTDSTLNIEKLASVLEGTLTEKIVIDMRHEKLKEEAINRFESYTKETIRKLNKLYTELNFPWYAELFTFQKNSLGNDIEYKISGIQNDYLFDLFVKKTTVNSSQPEIKIAPDTSLETISILRSNLVFETLNPELVCMDLSYSSHCLDLQIEHIKTNVPKSKAMAEELIKQFETKQTSKNIIVTTTAPSEFDEKYAHSSARLYFQTSAPKAFPDLQQFFEKYELLDPKLGKNGTYFYIEVTDEKLHNLNILFEDLLKLNSKEFSSQASQLSQLGVFSFPSKPLEENNERPQSLLVFTNE